MAQRPLPPPGVIPTAASSSSGASDFATGRTIGTLDQVVDVETPEQVQFSYTVAGVGSRASAAMLDFLLGTLITLGLFLLFTLIRSAVRPAGGGGGPAKDVSGPWLMAIMYLLVFVAQWGYYVLFEALWDGQTPGKRRVGLRVVQDGGYSVTFAASAVRNLVRIIDQQPAFAYGVGILSALVSKSGKRLGDLVAGTMVVQERVSHVPVAPRVVSPAGVAGEAPAPAPLTTLLTDEEYSLVERFVTRRATLDPARRAAFAEQLAGRFRERAPDLTGSDASVVIQLFERERSARARGVAARSEMGAGREQHAIVAEGAERWSDFAKRLEVAQRTGLPNMPEEEVSDFVARYREMATDLARLQTASRGREIDAVFYLSRLVAGGHNLLYRRRSIGWRAVWRFVSAGVPREIRRSVAPISLAALLLYLPAAIAWVAVVRQPSLAREFIPAEMIDRAEEGVRRAKYSEGYIQDPQSLRPAMASFIVTNNVQVTFIAFAAGITAGVGTVLVLVTNGISLGGVMGLYQSKGILSLIVAFVAPHGVLELTAICIAGGAGLLLASALLLPGAMSRREAFVVQGRRAIRLIAGSSLLLVVAGSIEGLISPIPWWPLEWKLGISALTAVLMAAYFSLGRGPEGDEPDESFAYSDARALISR